MSTYVNATDSRLKARPVASCRRAAARPALLPAGRSGRGRTGHLEPGRAGGAERGPGEALGVAPLAGQVGRVREDRPGPGLVAGPGPGVAEGQEDPEPGRRAVATISLVAPIHRQRIEAAQLKGVERPGKQGARLLVGQQIERPATGPLGELDRPADVTGRCGFEEVVGQLGQVVVAAAERGETLPDPGVGRHPPVQRQAAIEGVAYERVAEGIAAEAGLDDEPGPDGLVEQAEHDRRRRPGRRDEDVDAEPLTDHRGRGEQVLAGLRQPGQTPGQNRLDVVGHPAGPGGARAGRALGGHQPRQLLHEQRIPSAAVGHRLHEFGRRLGAGSGDEQLADGDPVEARQADPFGVHPGEQLAGPRAFDLDVAVAPGQQDGRPAQIRRSAPAATIRRRPSGGRRARRRAAGWRPASAAGS